MALELNVVLMFFGIRRNHCEMFMTAEGTTNTTIDGFAIKVGGDPVDTFGNFLVIGL